MRAARWQRICDLEEIYPDSGVCALVAEQQVAIFRVRDGIYAVDNRDPISGVNAISRGIVSDLDDELVVASPLYKQHFSLITGRCLEEPEHRLPVFPARISEGQVWVRTHAERMPVGQGRRRLVVIGNGVAAMRTIEELIELAPKAYEITIFSAEEHATYNRVLLSPVLAGDKGRDEIVTHPAGWFTERGITVHLGDPVQHIDRATRRVYSRRGVELKYDRLLIAMGSVPLVLPIPGANLAGVMTFRDLQDVENMLAAVRAGHPAVVIGGGLLGLEAGTGLARHGMQVTVVHVALYLMNRQLDARAGELLQRELAARGLSFCLSARTTSILGEERVSGVQLEDGRRLPADLVIMATGVRPNIELAAATGLRCDRGILVDDTLQTFDPAIYAVGECIQHRDCTYGLVAPLWDQARVCAAYLAERGVRQYGGSRVATQLKVSGIHVFSAGDFTESTRSESLVMRDSRRGIYKRLLLEDGKVRGAMLYGDTADGSWYFDLINEARDLGPLRDQLLFGKGSTAAGGSA